MRNSTMEYDYLNDSVSTILVQHRFPWKVSEIVGLTLFAGLGVLLAIAVQPFVFGLAFIAAAPYLAYVNFTRKKKSALALAKTPIGLRMYKDRRVLPNPDGVLLENISSIAMSRDLDGNDFVVLRATVTDEQGVSEEHGFRIPKRIYSSPGGKGLLESLISTNDLTLDDKVKAALEIH